MNLVHNHGPDEGPGLACPETIVNGRLVGECLAQGMTNWTDQDDEEFGRWIKEHMEPITLTRAEADQMYQRIVKRFDEACDKIEKEQDEQTINRLLYDVMGAHSYCIEVPRG